MKWKTTKLGNHIYVKHGYAFKGEYFTHDGEYVLLTPGNIHPSGGLRLDGVQKYYNGDIPDGFLLAQGDIIVVMTDLKQNAPLLGGSFRVPCDNRFLHNQRLGLVQQKDNCDIEQRFLYHIFNTPTFRGQIRGSATGATVRHTAPERIYRCTVRIPIDKGQQVRIAELLDAYDDLIEINRGRIALLEEAAQQLYKEWFVHLRFPGHESTKSVNGVPERWASEPVENWLEAHIGGGWGEDAPTSDHSEAAFVIRGTDMPDVAIGKTTDVPFRFHKTSNIASRTLADGDIVFEVSGGSKGQPVGRTLLITGDLLQGFSEPVICASFCKKLRPNARETSEYLDLHFQFIRSAGLMDVFATQSASNITNFKFAAFLEQHRILRPTDAVLQQFNRVVTGIYQQVRLLGRQNLKLNEARDLLLPRLMSGEIEL